MIKRVKDNLNESVIMHISKSFDNLFEEIGDTFDKFQSTYGIITINWYKFE